MKSIKAELILASKSATNGITLFTFKLTYPRFILAEVNTHRAFSRNTSSSRAIPQKIYRRNVLDNPVIPAYMGEKKAGMQSGDEVTGWRRFLGRAIWAGARYPALAASWSLEKLGFHKQVGNRLLEPWVWTEQLVTFTDFKNFLALRHHEAAEPHFQEVARQVAEIISEVQRTFSYGNNPMPVENTPEAFYKFRAISCKCQWLNATEWHLPFITPADELKFTLDEQKQLSAARCAWLSYELPGEDGMNDIARAQRTFKKLAGSEPKHLSPFEHQAKPTYGRGYIGNLRGWMQYRKEFDNEDGGDRA